ncbi:MAG: hypothetical protein MRZ79_22925 [Bacteroidia bacterium]|nr:hypothetical protein [Bacteroidia bacterium]
MKQSGRFIYLSIAIMAFFLLSCENFSGESLKGSNWTASFKRGSSDTSSLSHNWVEPELIIKMKNESDTACIYPYFEFYPIEYKAFIEKKLMSYLVLRATTFPPAPRIFVNENSLVFAWIMFSDRRLRIDKDLRDYLKTTDVINAECCYCEEILDAVQEKYALKEEDNVGEKSKFW